MAGIRDALSTARVTFTDVVGAASDYTLDAGTSDGHQSAVLDEVRGVAVAAACHARVAAAAAAAGMSIERGTDEFGSGVLVATGSGLQAMRVLGDLDASEYAGVYGLQMDIQDAPYAAEDELKRCMSRLVRGQLQYGRGAESTPDDGGDHGTPRRIGLSEDANIESVQAVIDALHETFSAPTQLMASERSDDDGVMTLVTKHGTVFTLNLVRQPTLRPDAGREVRQELGLRQADDPQP